MLDPKNTLNISLTEPVIFLRSCDPSGRLQTGSNDPPTLVRGVLTLNVVKPIEISSIEVEFTGLLAVARPEGFGPYYGEVPERQKIYSSSVTVFRAGKVPHRIRPASVGPGLSIASSNDGDDRARMTLSRPPSLRRRRSDHRSTTGVHFDLGPTPPYALVDQSPTSDQPRLGDTLDELTSRAREGYSEEQTYRNGSAPISSRPSSISLSHSNPVTHSDRSSTSNSFIERENDNRSDDTSPPAEGDTSFRSDFEGPLHILHHVPPNRLSHAPSPEDTHRIWPHTHKNGCDPSNTSTGRSRLRLSLTSVLGAVTEIASRSPSKARFAPGFEETERGRTTARILGERQSRECTLPVGERLADSGDDSRLGACPSHSTGHSEHREHHMLGLGRFLGFERGHEKEKDGAQHPKGHGEGWGEFKPGTYSYAVSILLPSSLPPTFSVPHGSLHYSIRGVAHRPGTFTSKLSCAVPVLVVAAPTIGAGEVTGVGDLGPLSVQKQWEGQLAYSFGLSSRLFLLGSQRHPEVTASGGVRADTEETEAEARAAAAYGTAILDLNLLPLEKVKIWRLSVFIDQRIKYVDEGGRSQRPDDHKHVRLLEVEDTCSTEEMGLMDEEQMQKHKQKHKQEFLRIPLLPTPVSPHRSPLLRHVSPSVDPSTLAGPGPYTLSTNIGLPSCSDPSGGGSGLHFTVKQKSTNVRVEHTLRLVMRVERVGDHDGEEKSNKLADITIRAPITVLSCRCVPEFQTLPRYSAISEDDGQARTACPCQPSTVGSTELGHGNDVEHQLWHFGTTPGSSTSSLEVTHFHHPVSDERPSLTLAMPLSSHPPSPTASRAREVGPSAGAGTSASASASARPSAHAQAQIHSHHGQPHHHHAHARSQSSPILTSYPSRPPSPLARYERLVSGLESEAGEAPPSYDSIAPRS